MTLVHGAETAEVLAFARINGCFVDIQTVGDDIELNGDISLDTADTVDVEGEGAVGRGEDDVEEGGREGVVGLACVERGGGQHALGTCEGRGQEEEGGD